MWTVQPDHSNISDRQLRAVIDTIPALVWLANTEGAAEYLNRRWLEYTGLTQAQAIGWGWTVAVHPEDLDRLTNYWRSLLQSGVRGETEARLRRVDGEYGWFKFTAEPLHDPSGAVVGWCGTNVDIIDQANRALQASERELTLIIEAIPGFVWRSSTDGQLTFVNSRVFEYIGVPLESLRGNGWLEYVHPDDRTAAIDNWMRSVATGAPLENQFRLRRADGVYRWFYVPGLLRRTSDGQPTQWYGLLVDVEDRKHAEEVLRRTETQLARAAQTATMGELAASIAHEVNQPLSAVVATAHACLRWLSAEPPNLVMARQAAERIVRDGKDAGDVVRRVRALFKRAALEMSPVPVNEVIDEVLNLIEREVSKRRVAVTRDLAVDLPAVLADRVQIQHLLFNLSVNALDAMESVRDRPKALRIASRHDGPDGVVVEMRDTGVGLTDPDRAFEPFYSTKTNGMGMGLAICRSIVEAHHGTLWVAPSDAPGTTFCFRLPVAVAATP
jgi:PAS domain S-box-containing protein